MDPTHFTKSILNYLSSREYPSVSSDQQRQAYKRDFDAGLQEYKRLQAELDEISKELSRLDKELDDYIEGSEEYKVASLFKVKLMQTKHLCIFHFKIYKELLCL